MKKPKTFREIKDEFREDSAKIIMSAKDDMRGHFKGVQKPGKIAYIVCGLIVTMLMVGLMGPSDEERHCSDTQSGALSAYARAKVVVRRGLREPESAIMPPEALKTEWLGDCRYLVVGRVRAKNGFGGYDASVYSVIVAYDRESGRLTTSQLTFE